MAYFLSLWRGTHRGLGFDHMIRALATAAVFHGVPRFLIEDDAEEENKGTLGLDDRKGSEKKRQKPTFSDCFRANWSAHLHAVEPGEQVVEDDHVAVDGEERQKTRDRHQEENATRGLQARAAEYGSHERGSREKLVMSCQDSLI